LKYLNIFLLLTLLLSASSGRSEYQLLKTNKPVKNRNLSSASIEYKILPQDRLEIVFYKDPSQSTETETSKLGESINPNGILVNASGYVSLPLVGKVKLAGLTQSQASEVLKRKYEKELNAPSLYVEILNKRLFVLGEVKKPGVIKIDKEKMMLFEALAFAGDLTDDAVRDSIAILSHTHKGGIHLRKVDLTNFDTMNYASLMLRPNNIVYVQPNSWKKFKVASDNYTSPLKTVTEVAAPFVTMKYLFE